jgi:hypothetical protein
MNVTTAERSKEKPMSIFTIDAENNITAHASSQEATLVEGTGATLVEGTGVIQFHSQASLANVSSDWPMSRFVEIWNGIPGNTEVTKFQDRKKAVARIWKAIQPLADKAQGEREDKPKKATKGAKPAKKATPTKKVAKKTAGKATERSNKKAEVIAMMKRAKGVTLAEIMQVTGWQAHTIRGFVSILGGKGGEKIESSKSASGERTYRIAK